jgi:hypothetical protein
MRVYALTFGCGWVEKTYYQLLKELSFHFHVIAVPAESDNSSAVEVRSVGASPRLLNIDPVALPRGTRPSFRENRSVEAAVSFDQPAQFNATLPNAGKVSDDSYSYRNNLIFLRY